MCRSLWPRQRAWLSHALQADLAVNEPGECMLPQVLSMLHIHYRWLLVDVTRICSEPFWRRPIVHRSVEYSDSGGVRYVRLFT